MKHRMMVMTAMALGLLLLGTDSAFAYLDPGTGSMILQSIIAGFVIVGSTVGLFWQKIKGLFSRSEKTETKNQDS